MTRRRGRRKRRPLFIITTRRVLFWGVLLVIFATAGLLRGSGEPSVAAVGPLHGQIVYIDPGHGGIDPGACGEKFQEKDIALKVALYLGVRLEKSGAKVVYSRTGDYDLEQEEGGDVKARIDLIESSNATIVLSIHCNAFTDSREKGAQTFYNAKKNPRSRKLAELIQAELVNDTLTEREASARLDHFMLNHGEKPAVTVELGFLSNPEEEGLLGSAPYQQKLADSIHKAVITFAKEPAI